MSEPSQHPQAWPAARQEQPPAFPGHPQSWPAASPQAGATGVPGYPAAGAVAGLDPNTAERSRKLRTWIGVVAIIVGAFSLIGTVLLAGLMAAHQGDPAFGELNGAVVVLGVVQGLLYSGFGIWTLATRRTTKRGPIIAVLVLASIGLLLGVFDLVAGIASGKLPQLWSYVLLAFLLLRSIAVLRLSPSRNPYAAIRGR